MILTGAIIKNFNPCSDELVKQFDDKFPDGLDLSPLWGTFEESSAFWLTVLADDLLKKQVGWGIAVGIFPSVIRANLSGANLSGANLSGAGLRWAGLRWVDLSGADLTWANLSGADLRGTDLSGADLRGTDLRGTDLRWVDLSGADLENIITNEYTIGL